MKFLLAGLLIFVLSSTLNAQGIGKIEMKCPGKCEVFLDGKSVFRSRVDAGEFSLNQILAGEHTLVVKKEGDKLVDMKFILLEDQIFSMNLTERFDDRYPASDEFVPVEIMPKITDYFQPPYPEKLKKKNQQGVVMVKALVDKDGKVVNSKIHKSSGVKEFDEVAVLSAYKIKFSPGIQNGKPVAVWVTYKVEF